MEPTDPCNHRYRNKTTDACVICGQLEQETPKVEQEITKEQLQLEPQGPLPDTGARREWATGAVRDASEGKPEITQIYPEALLRLAKRGTDGAKKYEDYNFTKGIPLKTYVDSLYRHLAAYQSHDTSEDHLAAIMWNAMGLMFTEDRISDGSLPHELDDLFDWNLGGSDV